MKKIKFVNYKAFNEGEIEICPLTLLLGANSSGKSSILHLLLMLEQTINNAESYNAAFKTNGHNINMGEDENLLKDKDHSKTMELEFGIDGQEYINSVRKILEEKDAILQLSYSIIIDSIQDKGNNKKSKIKVNYPHERAETSLIIKSISNYLSHYDADGVTSTKERLFVPDIFTFMRYLDSKENNIDTYAKLKNAFHDALNAFTESYKTYHSEACIKYVLTYNDHIKKLLVSNYKVVVGNKIIVQIINEGDKSTVHSDVFSNDIFKRLSTESTIRFDFEGLIIKSPKNKTSLFVDLIMDLVQQAMKPICVFFERRRLNYVGPLRANPQRYYFLDDSNTNMTFDHRSGASLAEILKKNRPVQSQVNKWMELFGLNVDVKEFKDVIHNIKVTQNGQILDIPDVGFGISQVLPILVEGLMSPPNSTIIMEQPEIHLHPKMQAELADLFIELVNNKSKKTEKKKLIIETHSEYILKRIRRRMAEGVINPKNVAIYFVKPRNKDNPDSALIERALVNKDGTVEWPEDFYITELEDEMAFLKAKIKKS